MKRFVVWMLCICMVLPIVIVCATPAVAATSTVSDAPKLTSNKTWYTPGEDILISAPASGSKHWIGIVAANPDGTPHTTNGTIYWSYIGEGLTNFNIRSGERVGGADDIAANKALLGVDTDEELFALPVGKYFLVHVSSNDSILYAAEKGRVTYYPIWISSFKMESTELAFGELPRFSMLDDSLQSGYIGISRVTFDGTVQGNMLYAPIADLASFTKQNNKEAQNYGHLPGGDYVAYYMPDTTTDVAALNSCSFVHFTVKSIEVEKTEFAYGEDIMVKPYGSGTDWVGITTYDPEKDEIGAASIRYTYIDTSAGYAADGTVGLGSGVAVNIREAYLNTTYSTDIPVGTYAVFTCASDQNLNASTVGYYVVITVTASAPDAPSSADYTLTDKSTGLAGGTVTVSFDESSMSANKKPTHVQLYWADENGNELAGFNRIGKRKITGATTEIAISPSIVIPEGAKKLMVVALNGAGTAQPFAIDLPADRAYRATGNKVTSFQIASDLHLNLPGSTVGDGYNDKVSKFFNDVGRLSPDSVGIFVAGDIADNGIKEQFDELIRRWEESGIDAKLYLSIGNHDFMNASAVDPIAQFIQYANLSLEESEKLTNVAYYHIERGGQHFIFLSSEAEGKNATISQTQLDWLAGELAAIPKNKNVFILNHQGMYNTVAGTLRGQGWDGINEPAQGALRTLLAQYPNAMLFGGHSHWILESLQNLHEATEAQPNYLFNTSSVSYTWTDNDEGNSGTNIGIAANGCKKGSQSYFVTVYENCVEFRGYDHENDQWVSNAYYRIWTACAHEGEKDCSTTCKVCGTDITPKVAHEGQYDCSVTCKQCGATITPKAAHEGEKDCSATCKHCGTAITPKAAHEGAKACSTVCKYGCGTAVTGAAHVGLRDCSKVCKYGCGTSVTPKAEHTGEFDCSTKCKYGCGTTISNAKDHDGQYACSTTCQYGCGTEITDAKTCVGAVACVDTTCQWCGEAVTPIAHDMVTDAAKAPTCTETGLTEGAHCARCNTVTTAQETVAATGHKYDNDADASCNTCGAERTVENNTNGNENTANGSENNAQNGNTEAPAKKGLSGGAIAGIVIAAVVVLGGGFALFWFVIRKKKI